MNQTHKQHPSVLLMRIAREIDWKMILHFRKTETDEYANFKDHLVRAESHIESGDSLPWHPTHEEMRNATTLVLNKTSESKYDFYAAYLALVEKECFNVA